MTMNIYGSKLATCTRRVATVCHELQIPFELIEVNVMNGENKTAEFLKYQPFGQIPYIDDDGFNLFETRAISRYLAAKYPKNDLLPTDPKENALFEQAAAFEQSNFDPAGSKIGLEFVKKRLGWGFDESLVTEQLPLLEIRVPGYEAILSKTRYLAGDKITLADIFHLPYAPFVSEGSDVLTRHPSIARWLKELTSRPSWLAYTDGVVTTLKY
ncbi:glutathione S-transferase [Mycena amicta]|nr:glutathione S-transferase [Mycena amicta]